MKHVNFILAFLMLSIKPVFGGMITDYSLDEPTNVVVNKETGLEWLQWDETIGLSVADIILGNNNAYFEQGWRLATHVEVSDLYNTFFSATQWDTDENTTQSLSLLTPLNSTTDAASVFIYLFGDTYAAAGKYYDVGDPVQMAAAWIGEDTDADQDYTYTRVRDEYNRFDGFLYEYLNGRVMLLKDELNPYDSLPDTGIALVRTTQPTAISEPNTNMLLLSCLLALFIRCRRDKSRMA